MRSLVILAVLALILSGCAGAGSSKSSPSPSTTGPAGPATVTPDTGGIQARVLDDEAVPLAGATVAITPGDHIEKSDAEGLVSFSELTPGEYKVIAERIGYSSIARSVDVAAGQVSHVNLTLEPLEIVEPYVEPLVFNGYIRAGNALVDIVTSSLAPDVCQNCIHEFKVNETAKTLVFEVSFRETLADPRGTKLYTQTYRGGEPTLDDSKVLFNQEWGNRHKAVKEVDWQGAEAIYQLLVCGRESVCVEQRYTEYVSIFHHEAAPEDFTALPPP